VGAAQSNGQSESGESEATDPGPGHRDAADHSAAAQNAATQNVAPQSQVGLVPGMPDAAADADRAAATNGAPVPVPASSPAAAPSYEPAAPYPADAAPASAAAPPPPPFTGSAAPFPPGATDFPTPPNGQPPVPGGPVDATGTPPYPPGPYPHTEPYPAPSIGRQPLQRTPWAAPSAIRTHRWGLGAYLLAEAVFLLVSGVISVFLIDDTGPTPGVLALALAVPTVLAASTALLITRIRGNGPRIDLGLVWSWRDVGLGLAYGFGGLALTIPASIIYVAIVGEDASSAVGDVFGGIRAGPALAALVLVIVVLIAPMCEEILYRGLLWGGIEKLAGRWVAFAVSTLLFAIAHFEFTRTPLLLVVAIPIAIARLYTGRLLASIVAHQINNLLPGIVLMLGLLGVLPMA